MTYPDRIRCFWLEETGKTQRTENRCWMSGRVTSTCEQPVYRRADTGEEMILRDAPAGAMYWADWMDIMFVPQLEKVLVVKLPNDLEWVVDSQSSNCTIPDDVGQKRHHCWIIEGELPNITVSKNGVTCSAGAGSILMGSYHGFLRAGWLEKC